MKFSYRAYPILEMLHKRELGKIPLLKSDSGFSYIEENFRNKWNECKNIFAENINYLSETFVSATQNVSEKMRDLFFDMMKNGEEYKFNGTFIIKHYVFMIDYEAVGSVTTNGDIKTDIFMFTKTGIPLFWFSEKSFKLTGWVSQEIVNGNSFGERLNNKKDIEDFYNNSVFNIVVFSMFKTFADVETKYLPPNKKTKEINCKYVNDTNLGITMIDSTWFTTLVKSDAFKVSGHFRLQACGENHSQRKLVWISDFQKKGYTRKAKKLINI
jgi:hypothetical protein